MKSRLSRLIGAFSAYALIAIMAAFTLDGLICAAVLILLGGLALKTLIAYKAGWN